MRVVVDGGSICTSQASAESLQQNLTVSGTAAEPITNSLFLSDESTDYQFQKMELKHLEQDIKAGLVQLANVRAAKKQRQEVLLKKRNELEQKLQLQQRALAELQQNKQSLRRKLLDYSLQKKKGQMAILDLETKALQRCRETGDEYDPAQMVEPMMGRHRKQVCAFEKAIPPLEKRKVELVALLKAKDEACSKIEQDLYKINTALNENPEQELCHKLHDNIMAIKEMCTTLAGISHRLILAQGAQQVEHFMLQLESAGITVPAAAAGWPIIKQEHTD